MKGKNTVKKFIKARNAMSPAVSATIIVAVTVVLVLVASNYAYQTLERQRGSVEFNAAKKSILTFDDAIRDVAWEIGEARTARFTVNYGHVELIPNVLPITIVVEDYPVSYDNYTSYVRYCLSTQYVTFGDGYEEYILGDEAVGTSQAAENLGRAIIRQEGRWINITLFYRALALRTFYVNVSLGAEPTMVNYVDIYVIKLIVLNHSTYVGDFDLKAKNIGITTETFGPYTVIYNTCTIAVTIGNELSHINIPLSNGKVVFNIHVAHVQIST